LNKLLDDELLWESSLPSLKHTLAVCRLFMPCKTYSNIVTQQALKAANLPKNIKNMKGDIPMNPRQMQQTMANMSRALPPGLLQQMGGVAGLQNLMKGMEGGGLGGLGGLAGMGRGKRK
jgi:signal recognition particle subunit SRP54